VTLDQGYLFWKILPLKGEGGIEMNEKKKDQQEERKKKRRKSVVRKKKKGTLRKKG